jgi:hypothetical protein
MSALEAQCLAVGRAGFRYSEPVEPERHRQGGMRPVVAFGRHEEGSKLAPVQSPGLVGVT